MAKPQTPYKSRFSVGAIVRVASQPELERFSKDWTFHHPLQPDQFRFAGAMAKVKSVGFYHGGDAIYELEGAPGTWHEPCLGAE